VNRLKSVTDKLPPSLLITLGFEFNPKAGLLNLNRFSNTSVPELSRNFSTKSPSPPGEEGSASDGLE